MFNEEEVLPHTIAEVTKAMEGYTHPWELILVNDGSTDHSLEIAEGIKKEYPHLSLCSHAINQGRGKAIRTGFERAEGEIIISAEADLSYSPHYIREMAELLDTHPLVEVVIASPYSRGGKVIGVPPLRAWISRVGNQILGYALGGEIKTTTGMLRGYRQYVLRSLDLVSDGKEIHIEILSKVQALGFRTKEIPATLTARRAGRAKFSFFKTSKSHLLLSFYERPFMVFGLFVMLLLMLGLMGGAYVTYLRFALVLNPDRPLITLVVILVLGGLQALSFGFIGTQIGTLKRELYRIQKENLTLYAFLKKFLK